MAAWPAESTAAIQFVLSDSFGSLSLEDRVNLIHVRPVRWRLLTVPRPPLDRAALPARGLRPLQSGIGAPLTMAFVEIVFDNSSHRFPVRPAGDSVAARRPQYAHDPHTLHATV